MKTEFQMTQDEMDEIIAINKRPQIPVMKIGTAITGTSVQEDINDYWKALGLKYGFDYLTVGPSSNGHLFFMAESTPQPQTQKR